MSSPRKLKSYRITLVEVLVHTTTIHSNSERGAICQARRLWNECGCDGFRTITVGRNELITADEVQP
jgi:hypothetical protein